MSKTIPKLAKPKINRLKNSLLKSSLTSLGIYRIPQSKSLKIKTNISKFSGTIIALKDHEIHTTSNMHTI
jgi:hypothetical protein